MAAMAPEYLESGWVVRMPRYCQKRSRLHRRGGGGGGREGIKDRTTLRLRLDRGKLEAGKGVNTVLFPVCGGHHLLFHMFVSQLAVTIGA